MNTQESCTIVCPNNKTEECAKFVIDDLTSVFTLSDIMVVDREYTFSCWIRSDEAGTGIVHGKSFSSTTNWQRFTHTFTAADIDLPFAFTTVGTYYIYHAQLEIGNKATDWTPAPEDLDPSDALAATNERIQTVYEAVSDLAIENNEIRASVSSIQTTIDTVSDEVETVKEDVASMKLESDGLKIEFKEFVDNGVTKVTTETGFTFDSDGMTVDSSDSPTKTQVTPDGMTVYKKDAAGDQEEVLEATSEGVDATNLHAKTYLIVGGRSRFENYGTNRTGCFWIGG